MTLASINSPYVFQSLITPILVALTILVLASCAVVEPKDGPPRRSIDVSHIPNAQPVPVVRTRAGNAPRYTVLGKEYVTLKSSKGYREKGIASWYGTKFHGKNTANGERYDMYAMTAAHKTLPIPSFVRVTHVGNGRSIIVKINDRGPFHDNRIIDLSYAAAKKLGVDKTGTALVDVEDVTPYKLNNTSQAQKAKVKTSLSPVGSSVSSVSRANVGSSASGLGYGRNSAWFIQMGAFQDQYKALELRSQIASVISETVGVTRGKDHLHRVVVGPISDQQKIPELQRSLEQRGLNKGYATRLTIK